MYSSLYVRSSLVNRGLMQLVGIFKWLTGDRGGMWMSFLTRHTLEDATSYEQAKQLLSNTTMMAPAYFILGGTKPHEVPHYKCNNSLQTVLCYCFNTFC